MEFRPTGNARSRVHTVWRMVRGGVVLAGVAMADAQSPAAAAGPLAEAAAASDRRTAPVAWMPAHADGIPDALLSTTCAGTGVAVSSVTSGATPSASSVSVSHTTSGTDRLMLVGVTWNKDGASNLTSVTYGGTPLTQVVEEDDGGGEVWSEIWRLTAPATGTANVVATLNGGMGRADRERGFNQRRA